MQTIQLKYDIISWITGLDKKIINGRTKRNNTISEV